MHEKQRDSNAVWLQWAVNSRPTHNADASGRRRLSRGLGHHFSQNFLRNQLYPKCGVLCEKGCHLGVFRHLTAAHHPILCTCNGTCPTDAWSLSVTLADALCKEIEERCRVRGGRCGRLQVQHRSTIKRTFKNARDSTRSVGGGIEVQRWPSRT